MGNGQWAMVNGQWLMSNGQWAINVVDLRNLSRKEKDAKAQS